MAAPAASASIAIQMFAARGHDGLHHRGQRRKMRRLCETLGASRAINYKNEDFVAVIKAETGGKGVDVILDMVGGDYIQRNMSAAALWGRIVNIAYQKGAKAEVNFAPVLMKRLTCWPPPCAAARSAEKGAIRDALLRRGLAAGGGRAGSGRWWTRYFPWPRPRKPMNIMAKTGHIGKILLDSVRKSLCLPCLARLKDRPSSKFIIERRDGPERPRPGERIIAMAVEPNR